MIKLVLIFQGREHWEVHNRICGLPSSILLVASCLATCRWLAAGYGFVKKQPRSSATLQAQKNYLEAPRDFLGASMDHTVADYGLVPVSSGRRVLLPFVVGLFPSAGAVVWCLSSPRPSMDHILI